MDVTGGGRLNSGREYVCVVWQWKGVGSARERKFRNSISIRAYIQTKLYIKETDEEGDFEGENGRTAF